MISPGDVFVCVNKRNSYYVHSLTLILTGCDVEGYVNSVVLWLDGKITTEICHSSALINDDYERISCLCQ